MDFAQQIEVELDYWEKHGEMSPTLINLFNVFYIDLGMECMAMVAFCLQYHDDPHKIKTRLEKDAKEQYELYGDLYPELTALHDALLRRFCKDT
jgi:hypothetical protein